MLITEEGITIDGKLVPLSRARKYLNGKIDPLKKVIADCDKVIKEKTEQKQEAQEELKKYSDLVSEFNKETGRVNDMNKRLHNTKAEATYNKSVGKKGIGNYDEEWKEKVKNLLGL